MRCSDSECTFPLDRKPFAGQWVFEMKEYMKKRMKRIALGFLACTMFMHMHVPCALATNIDSSNNEAETTTAAPVTEADTTAAPATESTTTAAPATEAPATEAPATEAPATEAPVADTEAPAAELESSPDEETLEDETEEETDEDETDDEVETEEETESEEEKEIVKETETEEETSLMEYSDAEDGDESSEEETSETDYEAENKTGVGTVAKVFAGIFMVVLVAGVVIYGYISMTRRQELRRRERRAREWDDYEDDE